MLIAKICCCDITGLKGQYVVYEAIEVLKVHLLLLDPKKITRFIADVTNAHDKECLVDITKHQLQVKLAIATH